VSVFEYTNVVGDVGWMDAKLDVTRDLKPEKSSTLATVTRSMNIGT